MRARLRGQMMQKVQELLKLTDEQREKMEPIVTSALEDFRKLRSLKGTEQKGKARALMQATLVRVGPILNSKQRQDVVEFIDAMKHDIAP